MTDLDHALQVAREEIARRSFAVTGQYLAVHQVVTDTSGSYAVARVDDITVPGSYRVYFPLEGEPYHCVVNVRPGENGELHVGWVYIQPAIRVYLDIRSPVMTAGQISSNVGIGPTTTRERGQLGATRGTQENAWQLEPHAGLPGSFEEKLSVLLDLVEPAAERIAALQPACTVVLSVVYEGWGGDPQFGGLHVDREAIGRINALGAALDLDLYASGQPMPDDDWPPPDPGA